eukprot:362606-Chlamydomonas_euryale.AAC.3
MPAAVLYKSRPVSVWRKARRAVKRHGSVTPATPCCFKVQRQHSKQSCGRQAVVHAPHARARLASTTQCATQPGRTECQHHAPPCLSSAGSSSVPREWGTVTSASCPPAQGITPPKTVSAQCFLNHTMSSCPTYYPQGARHSCPGQQPGRCKR